MSLTPTPPALFFRGRPGDPRLGEFARPIPSVSHELKKRSFNRQTIIVHGAPDDNGVLLNRGRGGAAGGPDSIRAAFYKMAWPLDKTFESKIQWLDAGNIEVSTDILATHANAHAAAKTHAAAGATVIALGGGHDFAAPHVLGWAEGMRTLSTKSVIGLINIDPHLDVRELENNRPHSGTPFRQILEARALLGKNFVEFGARDGRNARAHFDFCKKHEVKVRLFEELCLKPSMVAQFNAELAALEKTTTDIGLTIDMDSCRELEGVSAAPVIGFSALELCLMAWRAGKSKKVGFLELAEVAPALDPTGRAARIGAEILFWFLRGRIQIDIRKSLY